MPRAIRPSGTPRGIRLPPDLQKRVLELAEAMDNTFTGTVLMLARKGLEAVEQDELDRKAGERARIAERARRKAAGE